MRDTIFTDMEGSVLAYGDTVRLRWNGFSGLPKWLGGEYASIVDFGRTRIKVQPKMATCTYNVRMDQVKKVNSAQ